MFKDKAIDWNTMTGTEQEQSSDDEHWDGSSGSNGTSGTNGTSGSSKSGSRKRRISAATKSTADSPSKKEKGTVAPSTSTSKGKVLFMMESLMNKLEEDENKTEKAVEKAIEEHKRQKNQATDDVLRCLDLVLECGFDECSDEYYLCTELFEKDYNRLVFAGHMRTPEERQAWIKRKCVERHG
jgi:hypothetical protein